MSVIIKGVKMPYSCYDCCTNYIFPKCGLWYINKNGDTRRHDDCPLVEIPKNHGRLIDAYKLIDDWCKEVCRKIPNCEEDCMYYDSIKLAQTILEAEGEEEK